MPYPTYPAIENAIMGVARGIGVVYRRQLSATTTTNTTFYQCPEGKVFYIREFNLTCTQTGTSQSAFLSVVDSAGTLIRTFAEVNGDTLGTLNTAYQDGYWILPTQQIRLNVGTGATANVYLIGDEIPL